VAGIRTISLDTLREERRARGVKVPHGVLTEPIQRLVTSSDGVATLQQKVVLDVNEGREDVPLLYQPLYSRVASDTLPRDVNTNLVTSAQVIFLQRFEGGEVKFGTLAKGTQGVVSLANYATGFEYTTEMVMFNQEWSFELVNKATGEAYHALLNHLHLAPIFSFAYPAGNVTAADATGATLLDRTRNTLIAAIRAASLAKNPRRPGSILLASTANKYQIEDAIARRFDNVGNSLPAVSDIQTIIYYDGWDGMVGDKPYSYPGVPSGQAFLIYPKRRLIEVVRTENGEDLIVKRGNADVSRNIEDQFTAQTFRTLYADCAGSVQKIVLPA
jgi:hypothetical protein